MNVKVSGGFYTWDYLDNEEKGFTPWPTLIQPDGSFSFSMDMGELYSMNYSTGFLAAKNGNGLAEKLRCRQSFFYPTAET